MAPKAADLNKDNEVTPAERRRYNKKRDAADMKAQGFVDRNDDGVPDADRLDKKELSQEYGYALKVIYANDELKSLFEQAFNDKNTGQWTKEKFIAAVQGSDWYANNASYARETWIAQQMGGADWDALQQQASMAIQDAANRTGASLTPQEMDDLTQKYLFEGWSKPGRQALLDQAVANQIKYQSGPDGSATMLRGESGDVAEKLRSTAYRNGLTYSNEWYLSAAKSVASGLTTVDEWERGLRDQAATLYPVFGKQIKGGMDAYDMASPYINMMAQEFEISPDEISLNDSHVRSALGGFDKNGEPVATNLWDFQKQLRNDPRWMQTKAATNEISGIANSVLKMFGMAG